MPVRLPAVMVDQEKATDACELLPGIALRVAKDWPITPWRSRSHQLASERRDFGPHRSFKVCFQCQAEPCGLRRCLRGLPMDQTPRKKLTRRARRGILRSSAERGRSLPGMPRSQPISWIKEAIMLPNRRPTAGPHLSFLLGHLLHRIATLIIVALSLSHSICHVIAEDLADKPCRPNIVLILADDKYDASGPDRSRLRETASIVGIFHQFKIQMSCV
jgi:hypothetical protein